MTRCLLILINVESLVGECKKRGGDNDFLDITDVSNDTCAFCSTLNFVKQFYIAEQIIVFTCISNNIIQTDKFLKLKNKFFLCNSWKCFHLKLSQMKLGIFITLYKQLKRAKLENKKFPKTLVSCPVFILLLTSYMCNNN